MMSTAIVFIIAILSNLVCATPHLPSLLRQQTCPVVLQPDPPASSQSHSTPPIFTAKRSHRLLSSKSTQRPDTPANAPRIVNGEFLNSPTLRKMVVAVVNFEILGPSFCSGSLIAQRWVLTAAHCEADPFVTSVFVDTERVFTDIFGQVFFVDGREIRLSDAYNHPMYNFDDPFRRAHDIALLRLDRSADSSSFMRINVLSDQPVQASMARVSGFGKTIFQEEEPADTEGFLRQVDIPVFPDDRCEEVYPDEVLLDRQVCAGYASLECGSCQGDSGGPLFQYDENDNPVQIGIVSFAQNCAQPGIPTVFVRPEAFEDWMRDIGAEFTPGPNIRVVLSDDFDGSGVNGGAIAGGVIAAIVVIAFIAGALFIRKRRKARDDSEPSMDPAANSATLVPPPPAAPTAYTDTSGNVGGGNIPPPAMPNSVGNTYGVAGTTAYPSAALQQYPLPPPTPQSYIPYTPTAPIGPPVDMAGATQPAAPSHPVYAAGPLPPGGTPLVNAAVLGENNAIANTPPTGQAEMRYGATVSVAETSRGVTQTEYAVPYGPVVPTEPAAVSPGGDGGGAPSGNTN